MVRTDYKYDAARSGELRHLYLDLLKRALTHSLYWPLDLYWSTDFKAPEMRKAVGEAFARGEVDLRQMRAEGRDWPQFGQTMVGMRRLDNVQRCVESVLADRVAGDLVEAGTWRGGVAILMRGLLKAFGVTDRTVYAADSFCGLPPPNSQKYPADALDAHHTADVLAVSREDVEQNFRLYDLLDRQVSFLEGWFRDTLPTVRDHTWAVVRVDGDMYESTMDALENLYPGLSVGGYLIIDDFAHEPCRKAVEEFRTARSIDEPIEEIDWTGVFWRRRP
jgi:O-methyltransferase